MTEWMEELAHYRKFAREVLDEDSGLEVWTRDEFQGIKLIAEAQKEAYDDGRTDEQMRKVK